MARRIDVVLEEMLAAIDAVDGAVGGRSQAAFQADAFLQLGVERALEIISEAVRHLPEEILATQADIRWADVRALGNLIRHEYWRVDSKIVWRIVKDDLPPLRSAIADMLLHQSS
ncbi:Uncharacterized conserved protein, contains HEPN domain [Bosea lupini]|uniref:Uncharacterized conserved protein, contains HEPN domain n=1 Tax=Bosea lupini TaxID=1036779 RepID=A0A1H7WLG3_9HYPH|nr:HepT-like ribonuclease domain-containing protein [Bosea lupini]SEM22482.1 Uncharacterized conserved protein, contains HEPN domain [Bosea lupini]